MECLSRTTGQLFGRILERVSLPPKKSTPITPPTVVARPVMVEFPNVT